MTFSGLKLTIKKVIPHLINFATKKVFTAKFEIRAEEITKELTTQNHKRSALQVSTTFGCAAHPNRSPNSSCLLLAIL